MKYKEPDINRLLKTFRLEKADRVPNFENVIDKRAASYILGKESPGTLSMDNPADHIELVRRIGMDAIGFGIYFQPGQIAGYASDGSYHYIDGSIKDWNDLKKIKKTDLEPSFEKVEKYLKAAKGTDIGVYVYTHGPFDPAYLGVGMLDFMYKLHDDIKFVEAVMDFMHEVQCGITKRLSEYPLSFILIVDDVALGHGLMIQPDMFKELWIPRLKKQIEPVKKKNIPLTFHSDGDLTEIIPILIDLGFCGVNPLEPAGNNIYEIKAKYGDKICLIGNMDIAGPLAFGTKEEIEAEVREHIDRLAPGSGYIAASSSSITDGIPPENFLTMIEAVHEYGRY